MSRSDFNILSTAKGLMAGNLELIINDGSYINCQNTRTVSYNYFDHSHMQKVNF